jgi:peptide chain release factor 1
MIEAKLEQVEQRHRELESLLADPQVIADQARYRALSREYKQSAKLAAKAADYRDCVRQLADNRSLAGPGDDPEMAELARAELAELEPHLEALRAELKKLLVPRDPNDLKPAILEIRAGTGGEEAALFAGDLFRMYTRFAERKGYAVDIMNTNATQLGGFKEITFSIEGEEAYGTFKYESGVHRVQRVPRTEASGRLHTSAATVAVLPEAEEVDLQINPNDLRIDTFCSSGAGGQSVNTTYSAVRITHLPTGMAVSCQDERSQQKNKAKAMKVLRSRLLEKMEEEKSAQLAQDRKSQVKSGDRSEKIRTYNFPQNRVTDHRIGLTLYNLDQVMEGQIDQIVRGLQEAEMAEGLRAGEGE